MVAGRPALGPYRLYRPRVEAIHQTSRRRTGTASSGRNDAAERVGLVGRQPLARVHAARREDRPGYLGRSGAGDSWRRRQAGCARGHAWNRQPGQDFAGRPVDRLYHAGFGAAPRLPAAVCGSDTSRTGMADLHGKRRRAAVALGQQGAVLFGKGHAHAGQADGRADWERCQSGRQSACAVRVFIQRGPSSRTTSTCTRHHRTASAS